MDGEATRRDRLRFARMVWPSVLVRLGFRLASDLASVKLDPMNKPSPRQSAHRVLAIVPAFNEAGTVGCVVKDLLSLSGVEVVVIDDGSTDGTGDIAKAAGARVITFPANLGIGAALRAGFMAAEHLECDAAFQFDADGQHDIGSVGSLLEPVLSGQSDLVVGSRFRGDSQYLVSRGRRFAMRVVALVVRLVTSLEVTDASSGFRAFSPDAIHLFAAGYPIDYMDSVEALVMADHAGLRVSETVATMEQRKSGTSSAGVLSAAWHTMRAVFSIFVAHWQPVVRREKAGQNHGSGE